MKMITWVYVITGYIAIFIGLPYTIELIQSGEWGMLRSEAYEGEAVLTQNVYQYLAGNIHSYLNPIGIVLCFAQLLNPKRSKFLTFSLFFTWLFNDFMAAASIASRSMVASLVFKIIVIFVLFKDCIGKKVKRLAIVMVALAMGLIALYMVSVSISRFGEDSAGDSVIYYMGHSMLAFNDRIMGSMHDFAYGQHFFKSLIGFVGGNTVIDYKALGAGAVVDGDFYTYVGSFYIDWGVFTIIVVSILSAFLGHFTKKKRKTLKDFIFIIFLATYYLDGVFVVGSGTAWQFIMTGVIYLLVKIAENEHAPKQSMVIKKN